MTQIFSPCMSPRQRFVLVDEDGFPWVSTLMRVDAEGYAFRIDEIDAEIILPEEVLERMFDEEMAVEIRGEVA
nr:hypothetical protein [uncultured Devosia sp.]